MREADVEQWLQRNGSRSDEPRAVLELRIQQKLYAAFVDRVAGCDRAGRAMLSKAVTRLSLSARGYDRVRKLLRTIADLGGCDEIGVDHVAEALQFRMS